MSIFIVDFHELDRGELLEVQVDQVGNIEVFAFGSTHAFEIDVGNAIRHFQFAIAGEAIIDRDPAVGIFLGSAGSFEIFIKRCFKQSIGGCVTHTYYFNRR